MPLGVEFMECLKKMTKQQIIKTYGAVESVFLDYSLQSLKLFISNI